MVELGLVSRSQGKVGAHFELLRGRAAGTRQGIATCSECVECCKGREWTVGPFNGRDAQLRFLQV